MLHYTLFGHLVHALFVKVVDKTINQRALSFGTVVKKARSIVVKYRTSCLAKSTLKEHYPLRIAGYVKTRYL